MNTVEHLEPKELDISPRVLVKSKRESQYWTYICQLETQLQMNSDAPGCVNRKMFATFTKTISKVIKCYLLVAPPPSGQNVCVCRFKQLLFLLSMTMSIP